MVLQDLSKVLQSGSPLGSQLVSEAFMRYYDLLSFAEQLCLDKKSQRKLRRNIVAAKQKLIFYLSYLKSSDAQGVPLWRPETLGVDGFVSVFANDRMY